MRTLRISHPAFFGIHSADTIRFYSQLLNMRIVLRQPNLDDASMEHVFFHVGEDNFIAYFLPYDEAAAADKYQRMKPGYGVMNHLALDVDAAIGAQGSGGREQSEVVAPMPGTVIRVLVEPGAKVAARQPLVVLEAMKMETPLVSPHEATVRAVHVGEGDRVVGGAVLVELDE